MHIVSALSMVESKTSVYYASYGPVGRNPPLVQATASVAPSAPIADATTASFDAFDPLRMPSSNANGNVDDIPDVPVLPTEGEYSEYLQSRRTGAGVASGIVGFLLGGPILAAIMGFGAAYAVDQQGATGDVARAVGDLALQAKDRAKEIDQKHRIVDKSKVKVAEVWEKAQEADREHRILERTKDFLVRAFEVTTDFVKRHRLIERGVECVGKTLSCIMQKIVNKIEGAQGQQGYPQPRGHQPVPTDDPNEPPAYLNRGF